MAARTAPRERRPRARGAVYEPADPDPGMVVDAPGPRHRSVPQPRSARGRVRGRRRHRGVPAHGERDAGPRRRVVPSVAHRGRGRDRGDALPRAQPTDQYDRRRRARRLRRPRGTRNAVPPCGTCPARRGPGCHVAGTSDPTPDHPEPLHTSDRTARAGRRHRRRRRARGHGTRGGDGRRPHTRPHLGDRARPRPGPALDGAVAQPPRVAGARALPLDRVRAADRPSPGPRHRPGAGGGGPASARPPDRGGLYVRMAPPRGGLRRRRARGPTLAKP